MKINGSTTFSKVTLGIEVIHQTLSITFSAFMLNVIMSNVIMPNVVMLNVVSLNLILQE
jgi:hypothetical protein